MNDLAAKTLNFIVFSPRANQSARAREHQPQVLFAAAAADKLSLKSHHRPTSTHIQMRDRQQLYAPPFLNGKLTNERTCLSLLLLSLLSLLPPTRTAILSPEPNRTEPNRTGLGWAAVGELCCHLVARDVNFLEQRALVHVLGVRWRSGWRSLRGLAVVAR